MSLPLTLLYCPASASVTKPLLFASTLLFPMNKTWSKLCFKKSRLKSCSVCLHISLPFPSGLSFSYFPSETWLFFLPPYMGSPSHCVSSSGCSRYSRPVCFLLRQWSTVKKNMHGYECLFCYPLLVWPWVSPLLGIGLPINKVNVTSQIISLPLP